MLLLATLLLLSGCGQPVLDADYFMSLTSADEMQQYLEENGYTTEDLLNGTVRFNKELPTLNASELEEGFTIWTDEGLKKIQNGKWVDVQDDQVETGNAE
jgi:phosphosulfolactate synthase (CoM biosynthesis protein A)